MAIWTLCQTHLAGGLRTKVAEVKLRRGLEELHHPVNGSGCRASRQRVGARQVYPCM